LKNILLSIILLFAHFLSFNVLAFNDKFLLCCHLDDRRDLFFERDFSSHTRRNDSIEEAFVVHNISSLNAQPDSQVTQVFTLIYNARFDEAEKMLGNTDFQNEFFYFQVLKLDLFWWKYSISKSKTDEEMLNAVFDWFALQDKNTEYSEINRLIWLSYKMRFEVKRKNYVKAFFLKGEVEDQLKVVQKNPVYLPDNQQKLLSVFVLLLQYSHEAGSVFGNDAEKQACLKKLHQLAADSDWMVSSEAHYFLGRIYTKMEKEPQKGQIHFQTLSRRFPQNALFANLAAGRATDF